MHRASHGGGDVPLEITVGHRLYFRGYADDPPEQTPILRVAEIVIVAAVTSEGAFAVFPFDGHAADAERGETVFQEEVLLVPLPSIPMSRLPRPFGSGDPRGFQEPCRSKPEWSKK